MPKYLNLVVLTLVGFLLSSCYVTRQALKQNSLYNSRVPVRDIIADPNTPEKTKTALLHVQDVLEFASRNGLKVGGSYQHYIEQSGRPVSYLVFASKPFALESKTWWFPIVGDVPYLGFFAESERDDFALELEQEGYDVHRGKASAFSSLGWFDDPIFSSMLERRRAAYTHLIFHELTHQTYWAPGSVLFNENLAEYIAYELSIKYFQEKNLPKTIEGYETYRRDKKKYKEWLTFFREKLETLYNSPSFQELEEPAKRQKKQELYTQYQSQKSPEFERFNFISNKSWNNARILASSLYTPELELFEKAKECSKKETIREFIAALEVIDPKDPEEMVEQMCNQNNISLSEKG